MRKACIFTVLLLCAAICVGCGALPEEGGDEASGVSLTLDENRRYTGFDTTPEGYTPDQAVADGCLVIVGSRKSDAPSTLYGGEQRWKEFLAAAEEGRDASLRKVLFLDGTPYYCDLLFSGGQYRYFDCEYADLTDRPYRYLRKLTGLDGIPRRQRNIYVLTNSLELTFEDVVRSFYSSSRETANDKSFIWLGFTQYLSKEEDFPISEDYVGYTDITPENMKGKGFVILKNKDDCDGVIHFADGVYPLGIGFGGLGLCDIKYYAGGDHEYLLFTYSWGSGLHRSHVGVFDLTSKETVFTTDLFAGVDVILSGGAGGRFDVYRADAEIGEDFCDLSFSQKEKRAVLTVSEGGITCEAMPEPAAAYTDTQLLDMVNQIMQPTPAEPNLGLSSNPYDYIGAHRETYDKLVAGGSRISDFFIMQLQSADTFGLDKYIMAEVCSEITGVGKDKAQPWISAKEWLALYERGAG